MESSLMYFRARGYDPRTGRFLQNDPVRGNRPWEHYVYASNNPETFTDPSGMQSQGPAITGGGSGPEVMRDDHGRPVIILFPSGDANVIVNFGPAGPLESGAELLGLRRGARFHPDASIVTFSVPNGDPRLVDIALLALEASNWEMNVQEFQYLTLHRGLSKHPVLTGYHERAWQQIAAAASPLTQAKDLQAHRAFARGDDATRLRIRNITAAASENLIASEGGRRSGGSPSSLHASQAGKGANRRAKDRTRAGGRTREGDELEEQNQRERVRKAQQKRNEAGRKTVNKFLREAKKRQQQMTQLREFKEHPPKPPTPPPADSP